MPKPVFLYRAVNTEPLTFDGDDWTEPAGTVTFGRSSGYLSRSAAVDAGRESGHPFEVVRSEPVIFLTKRERIERDIASLESELATL